MRYVIKKFLVMECGNFFFSFSVFTTAQQLYRKKESSNGGNVHEQKQSSQVENLSFSVVAFEYSSNWLFSNYSRYFLQSFNDLLDIKYLYFSLGNVKCNQSCFTFIISTQISSFFSGLHGSHVSARYLTVLRLSLTYFAVHHLAIKSE